MTPSDSLFNSAAPYPSTNGVAAHHPKPLRVAINGFGRIGRNVLRAMIERFDVGTGTAYRRYQ